MSLTELSITEALAQLGLSEDNFQNFSQLIRRPNGIVLVTGLSGAGKSSILHTLEDLGYETVDNPPFSLLDELLSRTDRALAIVGDQRVELTDEDVNSLIIATDGFANVGI